jgi:hypothetical protein
VQPTQAHRPPLAFGAPGAAATALALLGTGGAWASRDEVVVWKESHLNPLHLLGTGGGGELRAKRDVPLRKANAISKLDLQPGPVQPIAQGVISLC